MNTPFGIEFLEPITASDLDVMGSQGTTCQQEQTFHTKSGTTTTDLVCDD